MKLDLLKPETSDQKNKASNVSSHNLLESLAEFFHFDSIISPLKIESEMIEHKDSFTLNIDLPGLRTNDIHVEAFENRITVRAAKESRHQYSVEGDMYLRQVNGGVYERTFDLPCSVDKEQIYANYNRGSLEIFLPKLIAARQIEVQQQDMNSSDTFFDEEWNEKSSLTF